MKAALRKHFPDAEERIALLERIGSPEEFDVDIGLGPNVIYFKPFGTTVATAENLLRVLSRVPRCRNPFAWRTSLLPCFEWRKKKSKKASGVLSGKLERYDGFPVKLQKVECYCFSDEVGRK